MTATITAGPTLVNPEALQSVPELRKALHDANEQLFGCSYEMHQLKVVVNDYAGLLTALLLAHAAGDEDRVKDVLNDVTNRCGLQGLGNLINGKRHTH